MSLFLSYSTFTADCEESVVKDVTDPDARFMIGLVIIIVSVFSTILNAKIIFVILWHWRTVFRLQCYSFFVISMSTAGLLYGLVNLAVSGPCTLDMCSYISNDWLMVALSTPNTIAHWGYLCGAFAFSIYRISIFLSPKRNNSLFFISACLILPWVIALGLTIGTTLNGCLKRFNIHGLQYTYNCSDCHMFFGWTSFQDVNFWGGQILPVTMLFCYTFILVRIQQKNQHQAHIRDIRLTLQYLVICLFQFLSSFLFFIIPKFGNGTTWSILALNIIGVLNVSVNPIVLLVFNAQIRTAAIQIVLPKTSISGMTNFSNRPTPSEYRTRFNSIKKHSVVVAPRIVIEP